MFFSFLKRPHLAACPRQILSGGRGRPHFGDGLRHVRNPLTMCLLYFRALLLSISRPASPLATILQISSTDVVTNFSLPRSNVGRQSGHLDRPSRNNCFSIRVLRDQGGFPAFCIVKIHLLQSTDLPSPQNRQLSRVGKNTSLSWPLQVHRLTYPVRKSNRCTECWQLISFVIVDPLSRYCFSPAFVVERTMTQVRAILGDAYARHRPLHIDRACTPGSLSVCNVTL